MTKKNVYRLVSGCLNNLKDIKGKIHFYTAIVLLVALVLLIFAVVKSIQVEPVKVIRETKITFVSPI